MAQEERYGLRDLTYSLWHRTKSIGRFLGEAQAWKLGMIDIDAVEYDTNTHEVFALIETALDVGQSHKATTIMQKLAERANLPAYVVLVKPTATRKNPADERWADVESFRVRQVWPKTTAPWKHYTPEAYAHFLVQLRRPHKEPSHAQATE